MSDNQTIEVSKWIDDQPIRPFHIVLVAILFLFMIADGYDLQSMGFAAPGIVKTLHIKPAMLGPVFSASPFGMLFGAPLFGWLGDRFGRRPALIGGVAIFGLVSLMTAAAQTQPQLLLLRFLTGVGLGGVPVNSVALMAEYAPRRVRATLIVIAQTGLTFGSMMPALASGTLEGAHGWRPIFIIGALAPLLVGLFGLFVLPESLKFMIVKQWPADKLRKVASALDPRLEANATASLVVTEHTVRGAQRLGFGSLYADGLKWITPMIWAMYITFYSVNYFLHNWMPLEFRGEGLTIGQTAMAAAMFDVGGLIGGVVAARLVDRFGVAPIVWLYVIACPPIALIGVLGHSVYLLAAAIFVAGFCLIGITLNTAAIAGIIYPTQMRAKGIGWANGVGRFASIISPMIGGLLIGMNTPVSKLFLFPVIPMILGTAACFVLMQLCIRRFSGPRLVAA